MPDGDQVYGELTQAYEKPYEQICEGHFGPNEIAYNLLDAVRGDIKRNGLGPIKLLLKVADQLDDLPHEPLFKLLIDWRKESRDIERMAREISGRKRAMDLAVDACKRHLRAFQSGADIHDHRVALAEAYLQRIFEGEFVGRLPLGNDHFGIDRATFMERLNLVRPFVIESLAAFAQQIVRKGHTSGLRRPSLARSRVDANTDLLALS